jgi:hypothetical protein
VIFDRVVRMEEVPEESVCLSTVEVGWDCDPQEERIKAVLRQIARNFIMH